MARIFMLAFVVMLCAVLGEQPSAGVTISPQNPYRSFNISGVNYGSIKWEKAHRRPTYTQGRSGGIVFRRR